MNQYAVNGYQVTMTAAQAERWNNGRLTPEDENTITVYSSDFRRLLMERAALQEEK
jgi:hypothetical protein